MGPKRILFEERRNMFVDSQSFTCSKSDSVERKTRVKGEGRRPKSSFLSREDEMETVPP